jgi:hypothetical protein
VRRTPAVGVVTALAPSVLRGDEHALRPMSGLLQTMYGRRCNSMCQRMCFGRPILCRAKIRASASLDGDSVVSPSAPVQRRLYADPLLRAAHAGFWALDRCVSVWHQRPAGRCSAFLALCSSRHVPARRGLAQQDGRRSRGGSRPCTWHMSGPPRNQPASGRQMPAACSLPTAVALRQDGSRAEVVRGWTCGR